MAQLKILTGGLREKVFELDCKRQQVLGRVADKADFVINDNAVSRRHVQFSYKDNHWKITDLDSSNGTFINEIRIREESELFTGDQIRCGSTVLLFEAREQDCDLLRHHQPEGPVELRFDPGETMVAIAFESLQSKQSAAQRRRMMQAGQAALNMSHSVKNLLQALRSGQDVIDDAFSSKEIDQAKKAWLILKRNLDKIQKLVLDMLKFNQEQHPRLQPCQFNRLTESVVNLLRAQAQQRQAILTLQADEELGVVPLDPDQMQDVIMNLVLNAIEAVGTNGEITVYTEHDKVNKTAVLRVCDNGKGISDTKSIFEPFHTDKPNGGNGLGLAIAKKIVQFHKGTIEAKSLPGQGAVFTVRIPV